MVEVLYIVLVWSDNLIMIKWPNDGVIKHKMDSPFGNRRLS